MNLQALLAEMDRGKVLIEINDALIRAEAGVAEFAKPASVKIEVHIKMGERSDERVLDVKVTEKIPKAIRRPSIFFTDGTGNLFRDDPKQTQMFPKDEADSQKVVSIGVQRAS